MANTEQYNEVCKGEFAEIKDAIKSLDEAIRGNGKVGLNARIKILENVANEQKWLRRLIAGAVISCTVPGAIFFVIQIFLHVRQV